MKHLDHIKEQLKETFLKKDKLGILEDSNPDTLKTSPPTAHIILWGVSIFILLFIIWANFATLQEVTVGEGKVIPSSQVQVVQNLEGGIIRSILVREGDMVKKGQVLMRLDDTIFSSKVNELKRKIRTAEIEYIRLLAEVNNIPLEYDKNLMLESADQIAEQIAFYKARQQEKNQMLQAVEIAKKELNMTKPLVSKGAVSPVEVLRLERTVSEKEGAVNQFNSKTLERLNTIKGDLINLKEEILAEQDRLSRTVVRSPVNGIINQLKVTTLGGVITPGMDIMEIVPVDDTLLIEAHIRPQDIGFIHQGQRVMVKISAYDFSIYGGLDGHVVTISSTTTVDPNDKKGESFYEIRVRTQKNYLGKKDKPLYIIPGMQATVDILTGEKSVMDYLLKPILKAKSTALRER